LKLSKLLTLLLGAFLLAAGASTPVQLLHAQPVHAAGPWCGNGIESEDIPYEDTAAYQKQTALVLDSYPFGPSFHYVDTDLKAWHILHNGACWRAYYNSNWTEDNTGMYNWAWIRAWVCGRGPYQWNSGQQTSNNTRVVTTSFWGSENVILQTVTMWDGVQLTLSFARYGTTTDGSLCGRQADNYGGQAWTDTWHDPPHLYSDPANPYWYVRM